MDWLALPIGFAASPAIFALCSEAMQRTHHIMESENGSWSGRERAHAEIFVDAAIFVEAGIGKYFTRSGRRMGAVLPKLVRPG